MSILIDDYLFADCSLERVAESLATNAEMATYEFIRYKEVPPDGWPEIDLVTYCARDAALKKNIIRAIEAGSIIGQEVNMARELSNIPGGDMTPKMLANEAKKRALSAGVTVTILGEKDMKALKMGGILAVSRGSTEEAQLIVMEYRNGPKTKKPYVFVGKGVTFDSGGLHLKPSNAMDEMHMDMSGGASVIAAVTALARMHARVNVIGIIPAAENMPSGESFRPGDVLMSMLGKTVEVVSPDAEGRVIVADALTYAERYKPELVIDVATLTGAVVVALGHHASALFATSDGLSDALCAAAEASGDYVWPLPLWSEYEADIKGVTGDILNAPKNREAGCINGAIFLSQFAKEFPHWAHVDIASTMTGSPDQALSKGSSGSGTRLLIEVGRNYGKIV